MSLAVVTWMWDGQKDRDYRPEYVNVLQRMFERNLQVPHTFWCITDDTRPFAPEVNVMPVPDSARIAAGMKTAMDTDRLPSCYRRLWLFSDEARMLGERVLNTDIDCVLVSDITRLAEVDEDFVGYRPSHPWGHHRRIGGGTWLLKTGRRTDVWNEFDEEAARACRRMGYFGSDQAWISYRLQDCVLWDKPGIYQRQCLNNTFHVLPEDATIVHFNGTQKPWQLVRNIGWIRNHWQ